MAGAANHQKISDIQADIATLANSPSYREWELLHSVCSAYGSVW